MQTLDTSHSSNRPIHTSRNLGPKESRLTGISKFTKKKCRGKGAKRGRIDLLCPPATSCQLGECLHFITNHIDASLIRRVELQNTILVHISGNTTKITFFNTGSHPNFYKFVPYPKSSLAAAKMVDVLPVPGGP